MLTHTQKKTETVIINRFTSFINNSFLFLNIRRSIQIY